jgi:hypothetical protein
MGEIRARAETLIPINLRSDGTKTLVIPKTAMVTPARMRPTAQVANRILPHVAEALKSFGALPQADLSENSPG